MPINNEKAGKTSAPAVLPKTRGSTFLINHEFRDFWADIQHAIRRLGDVGPESDAYKDAAFHQLARKQDDFVAPQTYGTIGREDNKNLNRMEYDEVGRPDKKDHASVMKEVNSKKVLDVKKLLKAIKPKDQYTVNTSDVYISDEPLVLSNDVNLDFPAKK
jgi:hypothetical protein